jgi:penicillin-binding protein 1A
MTDSNPLSTAGKTPLPPRSGWLHWPMRLLIWTASLLLTCLGAGLLIVCVALAVAYPNLPDISHLQDYRPKLPLRVFTQDGVLLAEFGEERRQLTRVADIPKVMKDAVLAIEDARFYEHGGVDYKGMIRAGLANLGRVKSQGASTITMQVARNVYLSAEKTYTRKIYEILLTFKLEHTLTKDQILEIYMNHIFLGNRAYGFAAASEAYFGKPLKDITTAEAAMLAGLPKAPSAYNPIVNPKRARSRQLHIIERMEENGFITTAEAATAKNEVLTVKAASAPARIHGEFAAEMVRQLIYAQYGEDTYTRGMTVYTTLQSMDQVVAYKSLRRGILDYERRQIYRGPEHFAVLPTNPHDVDEVIDDILNDHPDNDDLLAAIVLDASPKRVIVSRNGSTIEITGDGLKPIQSGLSEKAATNIKLRRGAVVRISQTPKGSWEITQLPEVEGAFIAMNPATGGIRALVGGFDFNKNKFNHVTQAWRQPGSSFKPFIYSAALEKGFTPLTVVNDAPLFFDAGATGSQAWEPKNYDGKFDGPMSLRTGLAKSKNMISIRVLQSTGAAFAQDWITRFGFDAEKHPAYLTMALGAGSVTPLQMATGYSVFANGGFRVNPALITRITDQAGKVLVDRPLAAAQNNGRVIDARNAFVMTSLLQEVTRSGTAAKARQQLKRDDIYGKTGTTNDSMDAWFAGYHPSLLAIVWVGYDTPKKLGDKETGGGLSLPIWINFMEHALKSTPAYELPVPEGLTQVGTEWIFEEFAANKGIQSLGTEKDASSPESQPPNASSHPAIPSTPSTTTATDEKKRILDLFKN